MPARSPIPSLSLAARNIVPLRLGMYHEIETNCSEFEIGISFLGGIRIKRK